MREDAWKHDIGTWVERKGRRDWLRQPPPPSAPRPAPRAGFLPRGFAETETAPDVPKPPPKPPSPPTEGLCWVTVCNASPGCVMAVREFLDVTFGRTAAHTHPAERVDTWRPGDGDALNYFHVKFDDPLDASRAVLRGPLSIPIPAPSAPGEAVVVRLVWCADGETLDSDGLPRAAPRRNGDAFSATPNARNPAASTLAPSTPNHTPTPAVRRASREWESVLSDALGSSRSTSSTPTGPTHAAGEKGAETHVPSCLTSGRHYRGGGAGSKLPVWPLRGNDSVLCAFHADEAERRLPRRLLVALCALPGRISALLSVPSAFSATAASVLRREEADGGWTSGFGKELLLRRRYEQQQQLLRRRHYNTAGRLPREERHTREIPLASWVPCKWYERNGWLSMMVIFLLTILYVHVWRGSSEFDVEPTRGSTTPVLSRELTVPQEGGRVEGEYDQRLQGTIFAENRFGSDRYHARTL